MQRHPRGLVFGSAAARVARALDRALFKGATLQDLPDQPLFIFDATNLQSGALWRFCKFYMGDHKVGRVFSPDISLAQRGRRLVRVSRLSSRR